MLRQQRTLSLLPCSSPKLPDSLDAAATARGGGGAGTRLAGLLLFLPAAAGWGEGERGGGGANDGFGDAGLGLLGTGADSRAVGGTRLAFCTGGYDRRPPGM